MVWSRTRSVFVGVGTSGDGADLLTTFRSAAEYGAQPMGVTVTRVRGRVSVQETTGTPTGDFLGLGLIVEDRNSLASEIPHPYADEHADWMAWMPLTAYGQDGITGSRAAFLRSTFAHSARWTRLTDALAEPRCRCDLDLLRHRFRPSSCCRSPVPGARVASAERGLYTWAGDWYRGAGGGRQ